MSDAEKRAAHAAQEREQIKDLAKRIERRQAKLDVARLKSKKKDVNHE